MFARLSPLSRSFAMSVRAANFGSSAASSHIKRLHTHTRFSEVVIHNNTAYLAGQVPDKGVAEKDMRLQTESIFRQIDEYLAEAGSDKTKILSCTVYLKNIEDISIMNEVWEKWMPVGHAPARASIGNVALANPDWLIEVCVTAAV